MMKYSFVMVCAQPVPNGTVEFVVRTDERAFRFIIWCILGMHERYALLPSSVSDSILSGVLLKHGAGGTGERVDEWKRGQGWVGRPEEIVDKRITS